MINISKLEQTTTEIFSNFKFQVPDTLQLGKMLSNVTAKMTVASPVTQRPLPSVENLTTLAVPRITNSNALTDVLTNVAKAVTTSNASVSDPPWRDVHKPTPMPLNEAQLFTHAYYMENIYSTVVILTLFIVFPMLIACCFAIKSVVSHWFKEMDEFYYKNLPVNVEKVQKPPTGIVAPILFPIPPEMLLPKYRAQFY